MINDSDINYKVSHCNLSFVILYCYILNMNDSKKKIEGNFL